MNLFLLGTLTAISAAIAAFFVKFFRESKDRFYIFFSGAFAVLGLDWCAHAVLDPRHQNVSYLFLFRLVAFVLIVAGIVDKNRPRT
jgi:hypothetical protein